MPTSDSVIPTSSPLAPTPPHGLLLVGGHSSRMGQHKASLPWRGLPLYQHCLNLLSPFCSSILISLPRLHPLYSTLLSSLPPHVHLLEDDVSLGDIGPAVALLSAHACHPTAAFLVFAVDFPLTPPAALGQLLSAHRSTYPLVPVTCFVHPDGNPEPLLSVWEPTALEALKDNVRRGMTGPCQTIRQVLGLPSRPRSKGSQKGAAEGEGGGKKDEEEEEEEQKQKVTGSGAKSMDGQLMEGGGVNSAAFPLPSLAGLVRPLSAEWLFNCNTVEQWQAALEKDRAVNARG